MLDDKQKDAIRRWYARPEIVEKARALHREGRWEDLEEHVNMLSLMPLSNVEQLPDYLKQDMTVSIDIATGQRSNGVRLPLEGLRGSSADPWVLAVRDGQAVRQPVTTGLRNAGLIEIVSGLAADAAVVPASNARVAEGDRVRLQD